MKVVEPQHKLETAFQVTTVWKISSHQVKKSNCDSLNNLQNAKLSDEKGTAVLKLTVVRDRNFELLRFASWQIFIKDASCFYNSS